MPSAVKLIKTIFRKTARANPRESSQAAVHHRKCAELLKRAEQLGIGRRKIYSSIKYHSDLESISRQLELLIEEVSKAKEFEKTPATRKEQRMKISGMVERMMSHLNI
jgi:hypothetical protein